MYLGFQRFSIDMRTQQHWMKQQINTRRNLWNRKFEILALRYKLGIKEIPEKWSKIRRWMKMIVEFWWLLDIGGSWEMTLCKEEGPRHPNTYLSKVYFVATTNQTNYHSEVVFLLKYKMKNIKLLFIWIFVCLHIYLS